MDRVFDREQARARARLDYHLREIDVAGEIVLYDCPHEDAGIWKDLRKKKLIADSFSSIPQARGQGLVVYEGQIRWYNPSEGSHRPGMAFSAWVDYMTKDGCKVKLYSVYKQEKSVVGGLLLSELATALTLSQANEYCDTKLASIGNTSIKLAIVQIEKIIEQKVETTVTRTES